MIAFSVICMSCGNREGICHATLMKTRTSGEQPRAPHPVIHLKCHCWAAKFAKCPARAQTGERRGLTQRAGEKFLHNQHEEESQLKLCFIS